MKQLFFSDETIQIGDKAAVFTLPPNAKVLSTSIFNGGLRNDITHLFNFDLKDDTGQCNLTEENYERELIAITQKLRLPTASTVGMTTAVSIGDTIIKREESHGLLVTAIVTAGIENNGGCAGDPCSYIEENDGFMPSSGTINIILGIDADLPDGILFRAAVTATEAKTAAIRELLLPSCYSKELATGSGTDGIVVVSNNSSSLNRTDAGKHSLLGELIGKTVKEAVKEGLLFHMDKALTDMSRMGNLLKRFSINEEELQLYIEKKELPFSAEELWARVNSDKNAAVKIALITTLMDYSRWHHLNKKSALEESRIILELPNSRAQEFSDLIFEWLLQYNETHR